MKTSQYFLTAAIAGIVAGGTASSVVAADTSSAGSSTKKIKCYNTCTGKGACKTATHACKGQNGCEGDGKVVLMTAEECLKGGGLTKKPKAPAFPMPPVNKAPST